MILLSEKPETRVHRIIEILVFGLKVIGLAPFSYHPKPSINKNLRSGFRSSRIGLAYNILILSSIQVIDAFAIPIFFSLDYPNQSSVTFVIDITQGIICCIATYVVLISSTFRQEFVVRIMNRLFEIDRLLFGIEKRSISSKKISILFTFHMILSVLIWTTSRAAGAFLVSGILIWLFYSISNFVVYCFILEYFFVVELLAEEIHRVNRNLLKLGRFPHHLSRNMLVEDHLTVFNFSTKGQLASLKLLITIRTMLYEVAKDVEDFFSLPILISIGYFFFLPVYSVHYLITTILFSNEEALLIIIANGIAWILTAGYPITSLCLSVSKAGKEARLTRSIIHKLLATAVTEEMKIELKQFSLQLLHERFRFTAYGFFTLDCTLLLSILQATATYNVILIQFSRIGNNP